MYRGGPGQLAWVLHRITGIGVLVFLFGHIVDTFLMGFGPDVYNEAIALYRLPAVRVLEVLLAAALIFHALNGLRIILFDFWPATTRHHVALFWVGAVLFAALFFPAAYFMLRPLFA